MMTSIVASLVERSVSGVSRSSLEAFRSGADLVEVRLDHLAAASITERVLSKVRESVRGPTIATLRSSDEGGRSVLKRAEREKALRAVLSAGFEHVDLELGLDGRLLAESRHREDWPETIASVHFRAPATRPQVEKALREACGAGDIGKVAMPCEDAGQAIMLASVGMRLRDKGRDFALIGMGEQGQLTRVCAERIGSSLVYCSLPRKPAAPGQLDIGSQSSLRKRDALVLGLVGHPLGHSVSKPMQEAALRAAGLSGVYLNLDIPPEGFTKGALETLRDLGFSGLNVTIPHKEKAKALSEEVDPEAAAAGAVNTITFKGLSIIGKNTDIIGFTEAIESKKKIRPDAEALVVGAGGAARAAALSLGRAGAHVTVAARDPRKAKGVAKELGLEVVPIGSVGKVERRFDVIVNATPVGTRGSDGVVPVPPSLFRRGVLYFDMVYNPTVTRTMKAARARKATVSGGLEMLVGQGAASFRAWTGIEPDRRNMRAAARRALT